MAGPACPECGRRMPFWRTQWGFGNFTCKGCGIELTLSRVGSGIMAMTMFITWSLCRRFVDGTGETIGLIAAIVMVSMPFTYWLAKPERAGPPKN